MNWETHFLFSQRKVVTLRTVTQTFPELKTDLDDGKVSSLRKGKVLILLHTSGDSLVPVYPGQLPSYQTKLFQIT